MAWQVKTQHDF